MKWMLVALVVLGTSACTPPAYLLIEPTATHALYESSTATPQSTKVQEAMTDTPKAPETPKTAYVEECYFLTIRKSAGITGTAIGYIPYGGRVELLSACDAAGWRQVRYGNLMGLVNADYLTGGCE